MATVVVPFRSGGKSRLPAEIRVEVALAMLGDVLEAAVAQADRVRLVTDDETAASLGERRSASRWSPIRAEARERRCRRRSPGSTAPASSSTPTCPA